MWWKKTIVAAGFLGGFLLNPALLMGCQPSFQFDEAELVDLLASVEKADHYDFEYEGTTYRARLRLRQKRGQDMLSSSQSTLRPAYACSDRTFMRSAWACGDSTTMFVEGTINLYKLGGDAEALVVSNEKVEGALFVEGLKLERASINLGKHDSIRLQSDDAKTFRLARLHLGGISMDR